jgi:hypothetical protein
VLFEHAPVPDGRRLGGLPRIEISQPLEGQNSLLGGKNAGNFAESASFREIRLEDICKFSHLWMNSLPIERGIFSRAGNYSTEQGIFARYRSARPDDAVFQ